jgi:hypothetical protein
MLTKRHQAFISGTVRLTAMATALLMLTILTVTRSEAAFTSSTSNTANSFGTGTVVLTDDDTGTAMFTVSNMTPGSAVTRCITVSYTGTLVPAPVKLYGASTGSLDAYLNTTIEVGTGGSYASCTGFSATSTLYSGTLANFSATYTGWADGISAFTAAANPTTRTFRVTVDVQNTNAAQGLSTTASFTFEAQA